MGAIANAAFVDKVRSRLLALSRRERLFLAAGGAVVAATFLYLGISGEEGEEASVVIAEGPVAAPASPPPASPMPAPAPAPTLSGLVLHGVLGGGPGGGAAILEMGGAQRVVRVGREFMPGVTLKEVGLRHVVLATASGDQRLEFNKAAAAMAPAGRPAPAPVERAGQERRDRETLEFRTGLEPRRDNGRITGFAVRAGADVPLLRRAGLKPGDVIVAVNGQAFRSEEKVLELSDEIASSYTAEIEFMRNGRRMTARIKVGDKPGN